MTSDPDQITELNRKLDSMAGQYTRLALAWAGENRASFISEKSRVALDGKLSRLGVNFPRLVVNSKVDRLAITGFKRNGDADAEIWREWCRAGMVPKSEQTHTDYYLYGSAYITVWAEDGLPAVTVSTPRNTIIDRDPVTGEVTAALRRWRTANDSRCVLITPTVATIYRTTSSAWIAGPGGWQTVSETENPLGLVPIVPLIRRQSSEDAYGVSAVGDILDLTDALAKILADAMVTSEHYARPRRWATGLEISEDEAGQIIDPFRKDSHLQSEDPETKFGQFPASTLDGYTEMIATLTQQVGSLTGLPPHYLGLHGDQPASADGVRAAEAQLASAAYSDQRALSDSWARVAQLMKAVTDPGTDPTGSEYWPSWASPEIRTPAQAADAALKLRDIGVPLETVLTETLGYSPAHAAEIAGQADRAMIARAAGTLNRLVP